MEPLLYACARGGTAFPVYALWPSLHCHMKYPRGHETHPVAAVKPSCNEYRPGGHGPEHSAVVKPGTLPYLPAGQLRQSSTVRAPTTLLYVPNGHCAVHVASVKPLVDPYVPRGHMVHDREIPRRNDPRGHGEKVSLWPLTTSHHAAKNSHRRNNIVATRCFMEETKGGRQRKRPTLRAVVVSCCCTVQRSQQVPACFFCAFVPLNSVGMTGCSVLRNSSWGYHTRNTYWLGSWLCSRHPVVVRFPHLLDLTHAASPSPVLSRVTFEI